MHIAPYLCAPWSRMPCLACLCSGSRLTAFPLNLVACSLLARCLCVLIIRFLYRPLRSPPQSGGAGLVRLLGLGAAVTASRSPATTQAGAAPFRPLICFVAAFFACSLLAFLACLSLFWGCVHSCLFLGIARAVPSRPSVGSAQPLTAVLASSLLTPSLPRFPPSAGRVCPWQFGESGRLLKAASFFCAPWSRMPCLVCSLLAFVGSPSLRSLAASCRPLALAPPCLRHSFARASPSVTSFVVTFGGFASSRAGGAPLASPRNPKSINGVSSLPSSLALACSLPSLCSLRLQCSPQAQKRKPLCAWGRLGLPRCASLRGSFGRWQPQKFVAAPLA